jgi:hypothetical protein
MRLFKNDENGPSTTYPVAISSYGNLEQRAGDQADREVGSFTGHST